MHMYVYTYIYTHAMCGWRIHDVGKLQKCRINMYICVYRAKKCWLKISKVYSTIIYFSVNNYLRFEENLELGGFTNWYGKKSKSTTRTFKKSLEPSSGKFYVTSRILLKKHQNSVRSFHVLKNQYKFTTRRSDSFLKVAYPEIES